MTRTALLAAAALAFPSYGLVLVTAVIVNVAWVTVKELLPLAAA